jgi:hypothetical protein
MSDTNENTVSEKNETKKKCFIITPVVIDSAIIPVLEELGFETDVPHRLFSSGSITKSVINSIVNDDLVIANLTGLNPNVMYELGIRHTARKPIVHICEDNTKLPFDIAPERTLFYVNDMLGIKDFKPKLREFITASINEKEPSNPVYDAIQAKSIMQHVDNKDPLKYVIKAIEELKTGFVRNKNIDLVERAREQSISKDNRIEISCILKSRNLPSNEIIDNLYKLITSKFSCPAEISITADTNNINLIVAIPPSVFRDVTTIENLIKEYLKMNKIEIE